MDELCELDSQLVVEPVGRVFKILEWTQCFDCLTFHYKVLRFLSTHLPILCQQSSFVLPNRKLLLLHLPF